MGNTQTNCADHTSPNRTAFTDIAIKVEKNQLCLSIQASQGEAQWLVNLTQQIQQGKQCARCKQQEQQKVGPNHGFDASEGAPEGADTDDEQGTPRQTPAADHIQNQASRQQFDPRIDGVEQQPQSHRESSGPRINTRTHVFVAGCQILALVKGSGQNSSNDHFA